LHSSLVNLLLLASLKEKSTCRELGCFFRAEDRDGSEKNDLVDETARDIFVLFWEAVTLPAVEAFSYFQK